MEHIEFRSGRVIRLNRSDELPGRVSGIVQPVVGPITTIFKFIAIAIDARSVLAAGR